MRHISIQRAVMLGGFGYGRSRSGEGRTTHRMSGTGAYLYPRIRTQTRAATSAANHLRIYRSATRFVRGHLTPRTASGEIADYFTVSGSAGGPN